MRRLLLAFALWLLAAPAIAGPSKQVVITSGTSWTTPSDWNGAGARVDAIGGGNQWGGNYAGKTTGLTAIGPGHVVAIQIGAANGGAHTGSNTGSTCFNGCAFLQATVGSDSGSVGDVTYLGGSSTFISGGSGYTQYGGAAGPHGNGLSGGAGGTGDAGYGGYGSTGCGAGGTGNGNPGSEIAPGVGSGGGSCGAGTGGKYGGGGGASGAPGVLVITYTPQPRISSGAF